MACEESMLKTGRLAEFIGIVEDWRERHGIGERAVYRGHTDFNWMLVAKLFRDPAAKSENVQGDDPGTASEDTERSP
jgi:hypothetical protein